MKIQKISKVLFLIFILQTHAILHAAKGEEPDKIGNFSLPTAQQPGLLFGFGQNIVDKHDVQAFIYVNQLGGKNKNFTDILPVILYGIRDDFSFYFSVPFTPKYKSGDNSSSGIEDIIAQLEYAFINKQSRSSITQATIVGNIEFPSGSATKIPHTGFGAPSFFLGITLSHSTPYWNGWIQGGSTLTIPHNKGKFGNQFFYQSGIEHCFATRPGWIFAWMLEFFGLYEQKDTFFGIKDHNSGGNVFYVGPSIWISSEKFIFQLGLAFPAQQHLYGNQPKTQYLLGTDIGYKFN